MVFEKHVCWNPENFRKIVHTEAEASPDNVFLSVHTDNQLTLEKIDGTTHKITYREFLEEFLSDTYGNNVSSVIEGESGAGKSHLVQWLRLHIPETENRYVLTIPKSQTNLYSVLKMLIEMLPQDKHKEFTSKLEQRDTELTNNEQRVHVLLNSLATSIITDQAKNEEEEYLIPLLPKIFTDPYFRDTFFPNNSLVKKLISLIFLDSSTNRNLEDRQEFRYEDLPLNAAQSTHAAKPTQEILDAMNDEELLEISLEIINRNLDKAISKSLNFTPNDLIELMYEIRKYLGTQNKELVLLIEDFAQLQGLDTSLLQTLTVEGNQNLCQIRWAMAVTTGYYEKLEDTLRTRMVLKVNMDNLWDSSSQEKQENYIINLSSKYLNAIRLGLDDIENWFESYDIKTSSPKILNKCDECALKIDCHESFGEVDGVGLYPFNSISLIQMARKADVERFNIFRPRIFLNKVLHRNLNQKSVELIQNGEFPEQDLLKDFLIKRLGTEELHKLEMADPSDYLRRRTLLEIWSNSSYVVNLNEGIHKAFGIKQLEDMTEISTESSLLTQKQETILVKKQEKNSEEETIKPTNKLLEAIENWGKGHELRDGEKNQISRLIYNVLDINIQWDLLPVAKSLIKFQAGQIYFENQQTRRPTKGIVLDIKCSNENTIVLKTLYLSNQDNKIPENIELFAMLQNKIESWKKYIEDEVIRYFAPKMNWDPFEGTLELIVLECLMSNNDFQTKNFLFPTQMPQMFSNEFNSLIKSVYGNNFKEKILLDNLKRSYTGRKGGQITDAFFNLNKIKQTIKQFKGNKFLLKQDPMQEERTEFNDIKNRYQIWKDNFENALTEEVLVRVKLLEKIDDKVLIEEIGQSFRNKVENLISLLKNSGIRSYTSNNLNSLLRCNLKQAKESFLSISKLTSLEKEDVLIELFPSRKSDTLEFVKLIEEIDIFLNKVQDNTKQMFIEHKQASDISGVIEEIDNQINSIENSLSQIIGDK